MRHRRRHRWSKRRYIGWIWLIPLLLAVLFWWQIERQLQPIVESYSENGAKTLATQAVNEAVTAALADPTLTTGLIQLQKNDSGEVSLLETDAGQANTLKLAVTEAVLTRLETADIHTLSVPLGTLMGSDLLSGRGPKLPIKVSVEPLSPPILSAVGAPPALTRPPTPCGFRSRWTWCWRFPAAGR